jgi:hypothetical protein
MMPSTNSPTLSTLQEGTSHPYLQSELIKSDCIIIALPLLLSLLLVGSVQQHTDAVHNGHIISGEALWRTEGPCFLERLLWGWAHQLDAD